MAVQLVESYRRLGLSEKEAVIAASVESAVEDITKSRRQLRDAAKLLGMSDTEAELLVLGQKCVADHETGGDR
jgi:hypothetical protein